MTNYELRKKFIEFFTSLPRNHKEIPSASLVPENDPTSLFTSSGMQPLITYLLGEKHPLGTRLVNSQKCFRSQDIDEIGDNRHTTFFEMLGNWSLGDYFKKEQLPWIFEFLTEELGLEPKRLYVTVFEGDKKFKVFKNGVYQSLTPDVESIAIWKEIFSNVGIDAKEGERIFAYPAKKNWWSRSGEPECMPAGEPGGPDSEVFYDFGSELHMHEQSPHAKEKCHPNCDCGRFMEVANSVFMQYQKQADGTFKELPHKNVDFGGGLERMVAVTNKNPDVFQTDLYSGIIEMIEKVSGKKYSDDKNKQAMRVIADHLKAATFMVAEGLEPGNKQQGYVLRRLIRRSVIKMYQLQVIQSKAELGKKICLAVGKIYDSLYFNTTDKSFLDITIKIPEEIYKFERTLNRSIKLLEKYQRIDGKIAFDIYQSYGLYPELTFEIVRERGQIIDKTQFDVEFKRHQEKSRTAAKGMFKGGLQDQSEATIKLHTATHLLQQALRTVLGDHVRQKGSHITAVRLRFDFSHPDKLTEEEIKRIANLVNEKIKQNLPVSMKIIPLESVFKEGALTVPGVKYPEKVKVYSISDPSAGSGQVFSKEVCGGPHIDFTGRLGTFKIIKEEASGVNVRRIYAILES